MSSNSDFRQCLCGLRVISANTANPCLVLHNGAKVAENGAVLWMNLWMKQSPVSCGGKIAGVGLSTLPLCYHCAATMRPLTRCQGSPRALGDGFHCRAV